MIPRKIHYIWLGGTPKPPIVLRCLESWKRFCPGWELIEWGDDAMRSITNRYALEAYAHRKWAFVADYLRLKVLNDHGGFYLDTDLELFKPIDEFCANDFTTGFIDRPPNVFLNMCFIGAARGSRLIAEMLDEYGRITFVGEDGELDQTPNVVRFARYFAERDIDFSDAHAEVRLSSVERIYPVEWFNSKGGYALHHAAASWLDDWIRKVWFSVGPYKLVRFKRRKEAKTSTPSPLPGERKLFGMRISTRKALWVVKTPSPRREPIQIAIACNDDYLFPACVLVSAILRHTSAPVRLHVFSTGLSEESVARIRSLVRAVEDGELCVHNNLKIDFPLSPEVGYISKDTYLRFLVPELLSDVSRIIYLDIDLLVRDDLAELWRTDLNGAALAGVAEEQMASNGYPESLGMKAGAPYFNAGVLLMDLEKMRELGLASKWKELAGGPPFRFMDQDIINIASEGHFKELSMFWNFNLYYYRVYKPQRNKARIIHFTGPEKPWTNPKAGRHCNREWWKAAARLPKEFRQ